MTAKFRIFANTHTGHSPTYSNTHIVMRLGNKNKEMENLKSRWKYRDIFTFWREMRGILVWVTELTGARRFQKTG